MIILNNELLSEYETYKKRLKNRSLQKFGEVVVGIPYQKDVKEVISEL